MTMEQYNRYIYIYLLFISDFQHHLNRVPITYWIKSLHSIFEYSNVTFYNNEDFHHMYFLSNDMFLQIILKFFNTYYMNKFGYSNIMPIRETFGMGGGNSQFLYIVQKVEGSLKNSQTFHSRFSLYIFEWGVDFGSREGSKCFGGGS